MESNLKVCVYAICKDEISFVDKWLDNMSEADYIVVLDTGSTDGTLEKLKNDKRVTVVKQQVIKPWRFDVARNESMKLVPGDADILVCTDFDELFNNGWCEVLKKAWAANKDINRIFYKYAWSHNEIGEPTDIFMYDKIHTRDFYWKFPVHEVLWQDPEIKIKGYNVEDAIFLQHYPDKTKERKYYFDLLELAVKENPEDCHERMLLAREYLLNSEYEKALDNYLEALKMPDIDNPDKRLVLLESLGRCADLYRHLKNYDEALWYCQEFVKEDATYREPYFIMANLYNDMEMPTLAEASVLAGLKYSVRKNNWVERADSWISEAEDILSISTYKLKRYAEAVAYAQIALKHHPNDVRILKNYAVFLQHNLNEVEQRLN